MPSRKLHLDDPRVSAEFTGQAQFVRLRFKTLEIPPIRDGAVVGKRAALKAEAMAKILDVVATERFTSVPIDDDRIAEIFVREAVLRKIESEAVRRFVLERVKPLMADDEVLALQLEIEVMLDQTF